MVFPKVIQLFLSPILDDNTNPHCKKESRLGEDPYFFATGVSNWTSGTKAAGTSWARTSNSWNNARPTVSTVFGSLGVEVEIGVGWWGDVGLRCCFNRGYYITRWWQLKHFLIFTPKIGEMIPNLTCAYFSDGWLNHQLDYQHKHCTFQGKLSPLQITIHLNQFIFPRKMGGIHTLENSDGSPKSHLIDMWNIFENHLNQASMTFGVQNLCFSGWFMWFSYMNRLDF